MALLAWPAIAAALFLSLRLETAAVCTVLAGYLLLPSGTQIDLQLLPSLNKMTIPVLTALLLCWLKAPTQSAPPAGLIVRLLALTYVLAPIATAFTNSYELHYGAVSIQGFYPLDGVKGSINNLIQIGAFFIGLTYVSSERGRIVLLQALAAAAVLYSLPMLFEVRMSPQLHRWVYGYHPHSFLQQMRGTGFRPVVFLEHGLHVALFMVMSVIAAYAAARLRWSILRLPAWPTAAYLSGVLFLCKSLAAMVYAVVLAPVVAFCKPRTWVKIACVLLVIVWAYPFLRTNGLIPVDGISAIAGDISVERNASLATRLSNEDILLEKALQKPEFGWGVWGRGRVYDTYGNDISITDGGWIVIFATWGWLGYIGLFGLFAAPVIRLHRQLANTTNEDAIIPAALSLILAVNVVDLIPNGNITPISFLLAGSIAGYRQVAVAQVGPAKMLRAGRHRHAEPLPVTVQKAN